MGSLSYRLIVFVSIMKIAGKTIQIMSIALKNIIKQQDHVIPNYCYLRKVINISYCNTKVIPK